MVARRFVVLVVTGDRPMLGRLSQFLGALDYEMHQVADWQQCSAALAATRPDILLVDGDDSPDRALKACHEAAACAAGPLYTMLIARQPTAETIHRALAAGVDDFLARPIVYGELLARLRAGTRALQFDRRLGLLRGVDPVTQLANQPAFCHRVTAALTAPDDMCRGTTCAVVDLDFFHRVNRLFGHPAGDALLRAVAGRLAAACEPASPPACLGGGRFAVLLTGMTDAETAAWAEQLRTELAEAEFELNGQGLRLTVSIGLAPLVPGEIRTADEAIRQTEEALAAAKARGRNCVVWFGDQDDADTWADLASPGRLLERTVAADVMTPCPMLLKTTDSLNEAAQWLRQSRLGALPVVDASGGLLGLLKEQAALALAGEPSHHRVGEAVSTDAATCREDESLEILAACFDRDPRTHLVVLAGRRPVGLIGLDHLTALGAKFSHDTFGLMAADEMDSRMLVVPDVGA